MSSLRMSRRPRGAILPTLVIAAVIVVAFAIFTNIWTERLWYSSFDFGEVFNTMLLTRVGLFVGFGLCRRIERFPSQKIVGYLLGFLVLIIHSRRTAVIGGHDEAADIKA